MVDTGRARLLSGVRIAVLVTAGALLFPAIAGAAPITVTTTADVSGAQCTLRDAITAANSDAVAGACSAGSGNDVITITATGTINLGTALPILATNIAINGPGASQLEVRRNSAGDFRIFEASDGPITTATVSISDLTVSNGRLTASNEPGAGIENREVMTLDRVVITGNHIVNTDVVSPGAGAGIFNGGLGTVSLTIRRSTVSGNTATNTRTAVSGSEVAEAPGGGIFSSAPLTIERSTISGNTVSASVASPDPGASAVARGAAIETPSSVNLSFSTVSGNTATATASGAATATEHGGIANTGGVAMLGSTIAFNTGATSANLSAEGANDAATSTIISDPQEGPSCSGAINIDGGFNIDEGATCGLPSAADVDPQLEPLADNGGPTLTHKPAATSPAIDKGTDAGGGPTTDQRGQPRPFDMPNIANSDGGEDIGAFEFQNSDFPPPPPPPGPEPEPEPDLSDTSPPDTTITDGPEGKTKKKSATLSFSGTDARAVAGFQCKLDSGSFEPCSSPKTYSGLKKGSHTVEVRAVDSAGNVDPTPATRAWKVKKKKKKK